MARYCPSQTETATTAPIGPDAIATTIFAGTVTRISKSSPKRDVRLDKLFCNKFIIFIDHDYTRTRFLQG